MFNLSAFFNHIELESTNCKKKADTKTLNVAIKHLNISFAQH
jgi:hypothetical protein